MEFAELIEAKDQAIADDLEAVEACTIASNAYKEAQARSEETMAARIAVHQAIHDVLAEKGMHHLIDEHGTVQIYTATDEPPGWRVDHPIPGTKRVK